MNGPKPSYADTASLLVATTLPASGLRWGIVRTAGGTLLLYHRKFGYAQVFHIKLIDLQMAQVNFFDQHLPDNKAPDHKEADGQTADRQHGQRHGSRRIGAGRFCDRGAELRHLGTSHACNDRVTVEVHPFRSRHTRIHVERSKPTHSFHGDTMPRVRACLQLACIEDFLSCKVCLHTKHSRRSAKTTLELR